MLNIISQVLRVVGSTQKPFHWITTTCSVYWGLRLHVHAYYSEGSSDRVS